MAKLPDVIKLAERRDKKLSQANTLYVKMLKYEQEAEDLDVRISDICHHPKEHVKLKYFTNERNAFPQKSMWMCKLCYQAVDYDEKKKEKAFEKSVDLLNEAWDEIPTKRIGSRKKEK